MADTTTPQAPTEEQLAEAKAQADKKIADQWEGDFKEEDLKIPYKREDDAGKPDTTTDKDSDGQEDKGARDKETVPAEEEIAYSEPVPVVTAEDPGDYQPQDYSFDIEIDGKTYKVGSAEKADELADTHAEKLSATQLGTLIRKGAQIELRQERDKNDWQSKKDAYDKQVAEQEEREQSITDLVNGISYLVDKGMLPKIDPQYLNANWQDPEVAKQPGVKEQVELVNYMQKENASRTKAGIPLLSSALDAFNALQLEKKDKQEKEETKQAGQERKAAGARVASPSASNQGAYIPKGIAVGNPNVFKRNQSVWDN